VLEQTCAAFATSVKQRATYKSDAPRGPDDEAQQTSRQVVRWSYPHPNRPWAPIAAQNQILPATVLTRRACAVPIVSKPSTPSSYEEPWAPCPRRAVPPKGRWRWLAWDSSPSCRSHPSAAPHASLRAARARLCHWPCHRSVAARRAYGGWPWSEYWSFRCPRDEAKRVPGATRSGTRLALQQACFAERSPGAGVVIGLTQGAKATTSLSRRRLREGSISARRETSRPALRLL
jgi:hypothetical protein